jgi:hypothetical protein
MLFYEDKTHIFGFFGSSNELKMAPEKVREIKEWPFPRSVFDVRSFHGLARFYRKFIKNFSSICAPILDTVNKKNISFNWTTESEKGFRVLKEKIIERPILVLSNFKKTFQVRCDGSGVSIGTVLSQKNILVAYFNEKLNDTMRKYSTYDKDFYAIKKDLKKWRHYLIPKKFVLYSENQALQFITR